MLPCSEICLESNSDGYELVLAGRETIALFPVSECDVVCDYLIAHQDLWNSAAIHVTFAPSIWGSAPAFGVPFDRAVSIALANGHMTSKYYLPECQEGGTYKTLLVHVHKTDDVRGQMLQLQVWQYTPGAKYAHYIHALSPDFKTHVCHLDGATVQFSEADLEVLLNQSRKVKGIEYQKHFRLDGAIEVRHMHRIASAFLPSEELYEEAFEIEVLQADA